MSGKRVLFVTYGGGHVAMVLPVLRALRRQGSSIEPVLLALTTGHQRACAEGEQALGFRDLLGLVDREAALQWGQRLATGNTSPDVTPEETFAYLGINYLDLVEQHGEAGAARLWQEQGRYGFRPVNVMRRFIERLAPDAVVATNSPRAERAALDAARELGIPTIGMVDLFGLDSDTYVLHTPRPDWTCVLSEPVRERLIARGFPASSVRVTGNPAFDGLFSGQNAAASQRFIERQGWQGLKVILFAAHPEAYAHPATPVPAGRALPIQIEAVLRAHVRERADRALIVRHHPSDWGLYPRHPDEPRVHLSEPPREPLHPLILAASVVVVQTSTVGLESAVAGRPVVSVENSPSAYIWFSLAHMGVSTPASDPSQLPLVLEQVLQGHGAPVHPSYRSDGLAAERVADLVRRVAGA